MWISIFDVCVGVSVEYGFQYWFLVCLIWILIFGVGVCVGYANRFLVLILSGMDIDILRLCWCHILISMFGVGPIVEYVF